MKTYEEVRSYCLNSGRKVFCDKIATLYCRRMMKGRGYGYRIKDRIAETIQSAFLLWMKKEGNLSPASCLIIMDRRLTEQEQREGEVFCHVPMENVRERIADATANDCIEADPTLQPTMDLILSYFPDPDSQSLLRLLASGTDKTAIAVTLGISRPTLYKRINALRCTLLQRSGDILADDLNQVA